MTTLLKKLFENTLQNEISILTRYLGRRAEPRQLGDGSDALNAHNFPLDLAAGEATPVALTAPAING